MDMVYTSFTRKILESLFGEDLVRSTSPVSSVLNMGRHKGRVTYTVKVPCVDPRIVSKTFWRLRQTKILDFKEDSEGNIRFVLTEAGRKRVLAYHLEKLAIKKPPVWNGSWHIVVFDIPERMKPARNALGERMKALGLLPFQKSVWIYPYKCHDEIDFIAEVFGVGKYVHYIVTKSITNDELLRQRFGLS